MMKFICNAPYDNFRNDEEFYVRPTVYEEEFIEDVCTFIKIMSIELLSWNYSLLKFQNAQRIIICTFEKLFCN